jgi:DsbC/DsbD-like thiol-disulfide interchange protein
MSSATHFQTKLKRSLCCAFQRHQLLQASPNRRISLQINLMQKPVRLSSLEPRVDILIACVSLLLLLLPHGVRADPYKSKWVSGPKSSLRLIAAGGGRPGGDYRAGIEINLDPGALTYWRTPGGAGTAPAFSFEGSVNAAEITVSYPAPNRIVEDGIEVFGYRDHVIFPLRIKPREADLPVQLALTLSYAVCAGICLPAKGEAKLTLFPSQAETEFVSQDASAVTAADALVPIRLSSQERDAKTAVTREAMALLPTWRFSARDGTAQDLFAEAPPGWYFDTRSAGRPNEFLIVEAERPREGMRRPEVILTLKNEQQSYEFAVDLDASPAAANPQAAPGTVRELDKISR